MHVNPSSLAATLFRKAQKSCGVQPSLRASVLVGLCFTAMAPKPAEAVTTIYTDRSLFEASLGASVIDDYSNPGYVSKQSNAYMSSVLGETEYTSTGFIPFAEVNLVVDLLPQPNSYYCAGCNGSFVLSFTSTSVGTPDGVFGVGFDFFNNISPLLYNAFVTFGDNSQQNIPLPYADYSNFFDSFFGITSSLSVKSISFGLPNGQPTNQGSFGIDNLTIGSPVPGPLPLLGAGAAFGFSRKLRKRIKSTPPVDSANTIG